MVKHRHVYKSYVKDVWGYRSLASWRTWGNLESHKRHMEYRCCIREGYHITMQALSLILKGTSQLFHYWTVSTGVYGFGVRWEIPQPITFILHKMIHMILCVRIVRLHLCCVDEAMCFHTLKKEITEPILQFDCLKATLRQGNQVSGALCPFRSPLLKS